MDGFVLDRGFQVLLTAYPEAQDLLDYSALDLRSFHSGARIFSDKGKIKTIADPMRNPGLLFQTLFSKVATTKDMLKMLKLKQHLNNQAVTDLFRQEAKPTSAYLSKYGFSQQLIQQFFQPFFAGVFLDQSLQTSSVLFEFIFKMFSEGQAAVPNKGMGTIPKQIQAKLAKNTIKLQHRVSTINDKLIQCENGEQYEGDFIVQATESAMLTSPNPNDFRSCYQIYYSSDEAIATDKFIGLVPNKQNPVNNICSIDRVAPAYSNEPALISVTSLEGNNPVNLDERCKKAMRAWIPSASNWRTLEVQEIKYALPKRTPMKYAELFVQDGYKFYIGDYQAYPSLNGAIKSGREVAEMLKLKINA